jgi:hypothetical protein
MTRVIDSATDEPTQDLAQFEPDPEGAGSNESPPATAAPADDPQWIVWPDAEDEAAWAASELSQISAGRS